MKTVWFDSKLTAEEKENYKRGLINNVYLKQLKIILDNELRELDRKETIPDYTTPSWAYVQAHRNGYRQHLKQMFDLLTFEQE